MYAWCKCEWINECHVYADKIDRGNKLKMIRHHKTNRYSANPKKIGKITRDRTKATSECILLQGLSLSGEEDIQIQSSNINKPLIW